MFTHNKKRMRHGNINMTLVMIIFMITIVSVTTATVIEGIKYENNTVKKIQNRYESISVSELAGYKAMSLIDGYIYEDIDMREIEGMVESYLSTKNKNFQQMRIIDNLEDLNQILIKIESDSESDIVIRVNDIELVEQEAEAKKESDIELKAGSDVETKIKRKIECSGCSIERVVHYE